MIRKVRQTLRLAAACCALAIAATGAQALSMTQTNGPFCVGTVASPCSTEGVPLSGQSMTTSFQGFDAGQGTLTGVSLSMDGLGSGYFGADAAISLDGTEIDRQFIGGGGTNPFTTNQPSNWVFTKDLLAQFPAARFVTTGTVDFIVWNFLPPSSGNIWSWTLVRDLSLTYSYDPLPAANVPLPAGAWLMLAGLGGLAALRRRS